MNVIDFIRESATYMSQDRPDVYSPELAVKELDHAIETLRGHGLEFGCVMFTSYLLSRMMDDGVEEFLLTRKVSSAIVCEEEAECLVFGYTDQVNLPSVFDASDDEESLDDDDTW